MTSPLDGMIDASVRCGKCGTKGMWNCDCYKPCSCGWIAERGKPCGNPETTRCSSKVWNAPPHIEVQKGERVRLNPEIPWMPVGATYSRGYFGTIAATPRKGSVDVSVRWDGRTSCDRIRISWLDKVPS